VPRDEGREAYGVGDGDDGRSEKRRSSLFMGPVAGMGRSNWPARLLRDFFLKLHSQAVSGTKD
jgi:hypothetical protein